MTIVRKLFPDSHNNYSSDFLHSTPKLKTTTEPEHAPSMSNEEGGFLTARIDYRSHRGCYTFLQMTSALIATP